MLVIFALAAFVTSLAAPALAKEEYIEETGEKLAEGVEETATGWTEVPKEIAETTEESNVVEGVTVGTVKGAGEAVVATTQGVVKAATFMVPSDEAQDLPEPREDHPTGDHPR